MVILEGSERSEKDSESCPLTSENSSVVMNRMLLKTMSVRETSGEDSDRSKGLVLTDPGSEARTFLPIYDHGVG